MKETMIDAYRGFQEDLERTLPKKSENPVQDLLVILLSFLGLFSVGINFGTTVFFALDVVFSGSPAVICIDTWYAYFILATLVCISIVIFLEVRNK